RRDEGRAENVPGGRSESVEAAFSGRGASNGRAGRKPLHRKLHHSSMTTARRMARSTASLEGRRALDVREGLSDAELVARVRAGETALFELIMRRYNRRLFRIARGVLSDDAEA